MSTITTELIRDPAALQGLATAWAALWQRSDEAAPFQHPAWLLPWWDQFGTGAPRVAVLRDDDGPLVALLPLYDLAAEGKTLPMGVGLSDYCDALLARDAPPDAADRLLRTALQGCDWPCHLPDLPPSAALRRITAPPGRAMTAGAGAPCPVLHPADVPARQRRKLRMARNRAERIGGYAVVEGDTLFDDLARLHTLGWQARGEAGVLADPRVLAFHAAALPLLQQAGLLRLRGLLFGDATAAVIYALRAPGRLYLYLSGFDPARRFESPGTILLGAMLDEAVAEGIAEIHFLRGAEAYKYAWGAVDRHNATLLLEPP